MNFLAHYVIATRYSALVQPLPAYVVGTALPDLLPLASHRSRLRAGPVKQTALNAEETALRAGVLVHLATDAAFHKTSAFAEAQATISAIFQHTAFDGIRVRRFFLSHILVEMALDAVLLRADATIADGFYDAFAQADFPAITHWTEGVVAVPLPDLPDVLLRFAHSQYLYHYRGDEGVATGLSRVCARALQDTFEGANYTRLVAVVGEAREALTGMAEGMLRETAENLTASAEGT